MNDGPHDPQDRRVQVVGGGFNPNVMFGGNARGAAGPRGVMHVDLAITEKSLLAVKSQLTEIVSLIDQLERRLDAIVEKLKTVRADSDAVQPG